jgi:hypothetical protein
LQFLYLRAECALDAAIIGLNRLDGLSGEHKHRGLVIRLFQLRYDLAETCLECLALQRIGLDGVAGDGLQEQPCKAGVRFGVAFVHREKSFQ